MIDTEKKLEKLLNKLIGLGWKPRQLDVWYITENEESGGEKITLYNSDRGHDYSINDLCSLSSGLWQFVVEKKLYKELGELALNVRQTAEGLDCDFPYRDSSYLIMMSAIQEDKISFILNNIVLDSKGIE